MSRALRRFVCQHWKEAQAPWNLIALTDGARELRTDLREAFGGRLVIIVDWFPLRKSVCELASMLVSTQETRTALKKQRLRSLFHGQVEDALQTLRDLPVRKAWMHNKRQTYLSTPAHEIIDYARRAQAGKTIGSGRMGKGVAQVIGMRQKDNAMRWSRRGSYALGLLRVRKFIISLTPQFVPSKGAGSYIFMHPKRLPRRRTREPTLQFCRNRCLTATRFGHAQ